ncbi:MAG: hypothetical protein ATN35_12080 [Epulopiscium sp. Nele67-Bin004]|nr:MAG: hypothetical protein ATN35_12080 [Epulopiscium sp. Nele67-Bin004]
MYRENFSIQNDVVNLPVLFTKISGVLGSRGDYVNYIATLVNAPDTLFISKTPYLPVRITTESKSILKKLGKEFMDFINPNPFIKEGKLQFDNIKSSRSYRYKFLRNDMQDYLLRKIQELLDRDIIKGSAQDADKILDILLGLNTDLLKTIQKFDFTQNNPKIVYLQFTGIPTSYEDSVFLAFISLVGFDVVIFCPSGYQGPEAYYQDNILQIHEIGDYDYDMKIPKGIYWGFKKFVAK